LIGLGIFAKNKTMTATEKILYHNPRCSKSREALGMLQADGVHFEVREYLKEPPSFEELSSVLAKLQLSAIDIIRKKEPYYREHYQGKILSNDEWIHVMMEHPVLIERPIFISGNQAVIGRPPVLVKEIL
jgi:arsenate reductase (glutaredoxin)